MFKHQFRRPHSFHKKLCHFGINFIYYLPCLVEFTFHIKHSFRVTFTDSGYINQFGFKGNLAPCCSYELLSKAVEAGKHLDCNVVCGPIFSSDVFYTGKNMQPELWEFGILAVEMEAAALYLNAARAKKNALAICTISDSLVTGEELSGEERQIGFRNMMELALSIA